MDHGDNAPAWGQLPGEPDLWFSRFYDMYLSLGPGRTLDATYRKWAEKDRSGTEAAPRRRPGRAPGPWKRMAAKWRWIERARAWDNDERRRVREAHFESVAKMNERHQLLGRDTF